MGAFKGHVISGSVFFVFGLWWFYHVVREYVTSLGGKRTTRETLSKRQRTWKACYGRFLGRYPVEPLAKIFLCVGGIFTELGGAGMSFHSQEGHSNLNDFAHATMYSFFALSGIIETLAFYKFANFSQEFEYFVLASAFVIEGGLFYFHLHGRDMFDVRIHTILYLIVFISAFIILLEASLPKHRRELFIARTILTLTHGTWFWEISFTMYGPNAWFTDANKVTQLQLAFDTELMTISACWHLMAWCLVTLGVCLVASCLTQGKDAKFCCSATVSNNKIDNETMELTALESEDEEIRVMSENTQGTLNSLNMA